jgi:hypothetical protein
MLVLGKEKILFAQMTIFTCPIIQRGIEEVTCPGQVSIKKVIDKLDIAFCTALTSTRKNTNFSQSFLLQTP